ncbi:hypothetical protein ACFSTH_11105 [Paenibacillus yanchengensis]|uniref:Uncharacterized protein n=1 Tax=Paenibacillus yanchengensis TaxID=2035833 RepID=A0ABW4YJ26_9BACL
MNLIGALSVVTMPTDDRLESTDALQPNTLFGINSKASHVQESAEFMLYINGEQFAQLKQKQGKLSALPAREKYTTDIVKADLQAFYKVAPKQAFIERPLRFELAMQLHAQINDILLDALQTTMSTEEVVTSLQTSAEMILVNDKNSNESSEE